MPKPRLLIIVSFTGYPLALIFRPSILRQLHYPPTPALLFFFSLTAKYFLLKAVVSSKCVVSLRPTPSERHYCTDTARIPCDRQPTMSLSETDTSDNCLYCCLAVPLSGFGNVRVMPFCPPIPPLPLINCFTISLLLYKRQFLSTQAY
jgi:hypothetical protein